MKRTVSLVAPMAMIAACICPFIGYAQAGDPDEVVASVNDVKFLRKDLDKMVENYFAHQDIPAEQQATARKFFERSLVSHFVQKTLLKLEAEKEGITVTDEDRKRWEERAESLARQQNMTLEQFMKQLPYGEENARKEMEDGLLIEKLLAAKIRDRIEVDEAEVEKVIGEIQVRNAQIEEANKNAAEGKDVKRKKIEDIKKQLDGGADFAELAKAHSDCPSGKNGGVLGAFQRGQMVQPFGDAAFAQEIGKVGEIVETQFGYHLILVTDKKVEEPETVTASHILVSTLNRQQQIQPVPTAEQVREGLRRQRMQEPFATYLKELQAKAKIETIVPIENL